MQTRQPARSQKTQDTSTSALGSVNGKKLGRSRVSVLSEELFVKAFKGTLEVAERDALIDEETLELVEHGRASHPPHRGDIRGPGR